MTNLIVTIDSAAVDTLLNQLNVRVNNLQPVLKTIGHTLNQHIRSCFRDLKSPDGVAWKPLSPVTKFKRAERIAGKGKVYRKDGKGTKAKFTRTYLTATPLNDTGVLRNSIAYQLSGTTVEIGSNAKQAAMMNFGGKKAEFGHLWGDIPARQFMPTAQLPITWEQDVIDVVTHHLGIV
jgi:phage gpG-like protein